MAKAKRDVISQSYIENCTKIFALHHELGVTNFPITFT